MIDRNQASASTCFFSRHPAPASRFQRQPSEFENSFHRPWDTQKTGSYHQETCWFSAGKKGMTPKKHCLWFPLRESPKTGSFESNSRTRSFPTYRTSKKIGLDLSRMFQGVIKVRDCQPETPTTLPQGNQKNPRHQTEVVPDPGAGS